MCLKQHICFTVVCIYFLISTWNHAYGAVVLFWVLWALLQRQKKQQPADDELDSSNSSYRSCLLLTLPLICFTTQFLSYFLPPPASRSVLCVVVFWYNLIKLWDSLFSSIPAINQSPQAAM